MKTSDDEGNEDDEMPVDDSVFISVPSQKDIERALLLRKKRELLEKYVGDDAFSNDNEGTESKAEEGAAATTIQKSD